MKNCYKCGIDKEESAFSINENKKDKLNSECKECQKKYFKEYYQNNKDKHKKAVSKNVNHKRNRVARYKMEKGCFNCGFCKHPAALEFHHLDKNIKDFNIGANTHMPWELLLKEIEKCQVLCSNCHAIEHSNYDWTIEQSIKTVKKRKSIILSNRSIKQQKTKTEKRVIVKKSNIPEDEVLQKLLFEFPSEELAKQFNCSGSYLSKYCKKKNLKKPPRGYWS